MRRSVVIILPLVAFASVLRAAEPTPAAELDRWRARQSAAQRGEEAPQVDPKRIINDSNGFLKEREPEMTSEEYALYQKMTTILTANPELAIKFLEGMINDKEPPSPAFDFILGNAYYAAGQKDKAETHYRSGLKRYPTFVRAWNNLGVLYYASERYAEAVPCFTEAVNLGDRDATTFGLLGYSLEKLGNPVSAEMAYAQALGGAPNNVDWKQGLLRIYLEGKQFGRAEALVRTLVKEHPAETRYWLTYANILLSEHEKLKAISVLEIASANDAAGPDELALLGDLYAEQQLVPEATAIYQKLVAAHPDRGLRKALQFAQVLIAGGKTTEAEALLRPLQNPTTPEHRLQLHQVRADLLLARQQWSAARQELDQILHEAPLDGRALLSLGLAYAGENDPDRATFAFEAAARVPATTYRASLELANLELKHRHYAKSVAYLEKAYSLEKSDAIADLLAQVRTLAGPDS